mgnify:CR=1 FL=1
MQDEIQKPEAIATESAEMEIKKKKLWEIDIEDLYIRKTLLGAGSYGSVFKGFYKVCRLCRH